MATEATEASKATQGLCRRFTLRLFGRLTVLENSIQSVNRKKPGVEDVRRYNSFYPEAIIAVSVVIERKVTMELPSIAEKLRSFHGRSVGWRNKDLLGNLGISHADRWGESHIIADSCGEIHRRLSSEKGRHRFLDELFDRMGGGVRPNRQRQADVWWPAECAVIRHRRGWVQDGRA